MNKTLIILVSLLTILVLTACGGSATPAPAPAAAPTHKPDYQPTGPTIHLTKVEDGNPAVDGPQPTVFIDFSYYETDDPNLVTPLNVKIKGIKDESTEGINLNFKWDLVRLERPELYSLFDQFDSYQFLATIGGKDAIVQHMERENENSIWIEFVYTGQ